MKRTVLFFALAGSVYGGEKCLLGTLSALASDSSIDPIVVVPAKGSLADELDQMGIRWVEHATSEARRYWETPILLLRAALWLARLRPSLIYFNANTYWRPYEIVVAKIMDIPIVTHHHVVPEAASPFYRYSSLTIANSRYVASKLENRKAVIMDNPVALDVFDRAKADPEAFGVGPGELSVFFVGQVKPIKGIDAFLAAAEIVSERLPNSRFVIVGDAPDPAYRDQVRARVASRRSVRWVGFQREIERAYATADVVVMPSSWDEPFGRIVIEAGAAGKPIIATRVGGVPEIVEDGVNGVLVPRDDPGALASAMMALLQDRDLRSRMGQLGRRQAEQRFAAPVIARQLEQLLTPLMR